MNPDDINSAVKELRKQMEDAAQADREAFSQGRPALHKLLASNKVYETLKKIPV